MFKFETPIPPGIAAPDQVETRLGTLRFFDGFPDKATADKVYDNLDFQRGVQTFLAILEIFCSGVCVRELLAYGTSGGHKR
jgi:hypothetical protein